MTTYNFSSTLLDLEGTEVMRQTKSGSEEPVTIGILVAEALSSMFQDEPHLPVSEKMRRGSVAMRVYRGGEIEISPEELISIRTTVAKAFGPVFVVQIYRILGGEAV